MGQEGLCKIFLPSIQGKSKKLGKNTKYVTIDSFKSSLKILNGDGELTDNIEEQTWKWIQKTMNAREVQERIKVVQELIETIPIESV